MQVTKTRSTDSELSLFNESRNAESFLNAANEKCEAQHGNLSVRLLKKACCTALLSATFLIPGHSASAQDAGLLKSYDSFSALRSDILDFISGATSRVWMHSDYLTDGEIVTSLFVAKYRKIDVQVLLGRQKANAYMSRLNYLKNQNITVYLKPDSFKTPAVTAILSDNELVLIDGELDFMSRYKRFNVYRATEEQTKAYEAAFASAANLELPAVANKVPLVGKPSSATNTSNYKPVYSGDSAKKESSGAYTYGRGGHARPDNVPTKLPRETKWQRVNQEAAATAPKAPINNDPLPLPEAIEDNELPAQN